MKHILTLFIAFLSLAASSQKQVYVFEIQEEIASPVWHSTGKAIDEAHELAVDLIFIRMNTYGGAVDKADSIRTKILRSKIPVYALIENNAASAGALISLACDSIYMQPGSTIGAATVVNQNGEAVPDKYQSYMRKKMRATAEENGRNPDMAEAMVDPDKIVEGVSAEGKVLTFTVKEAVENGFCEGTYDSVDEVLASIGFGEYQIVRQELSATDDLLKFLLNDGLRSILILIMLGGIYFELQTPGVGFPILASAIAAVLFFAPSYVEGVAENWEIALFVVGALALGVELFALPGFGVLGLAGVATMLTALALSMIGNVGFDFQFVPTEKVVRAFTISIGGFVVSTVGTIWLAGRLMKTNLLTNMVVNTIQDREDGYIGTDINLNNYMGKTGVTATRLNPAGKVEVDGEMLDASAETGFIDAGEKVVVKRVSGAQVFVRSAS